MRTRAEILQDQERIDSYGTFDEESAINTELCLEVLLDIRELLFKV